MTTIMPFYYLKTNKRDFFTALGQIDALEPVTNKKAKKTILLDIPRTDLLMSAENAKFFEDKAIDSEGVDTYMQGDYSSHIITYLIQRDYFKKHEHYLFQKKDNPKLENSPITTSFTFLNKQGEVCGLSIYHHEDNPSEFIMSLTKNSDKKPEEQEIHILSTYDFNQALTNKEPNFNPQISDQDLSKALNSFLQIIQPDETYVPGFFKMLFDPAYWIDASKIKTIQQVMTKYLFRKKGDLFDPEPFNIIKDYSKDEMDSLCLDEELAFLAEHEINLTNEEIFTIQDKNSRINKALIYFKNQELNADTKLKGTTIILDFFIQFVRFTDDFDDAWEKAKFCASTKFPDSQTLISQDFFALTEKAFFTPKMFELLKLDFFEQRAVLSLFSNWVNQNQSLLKGHEASFLIQLEKHEPFLLQLSKEKNSSNALKAIFSLLAINSDIKLPDFTFNKSYEKLLTSAINNLKKPEKLTLQHSELINKFLEKIKLIEEKYSNDPDYADNMQYFLSHAFNIILTTDKATKADDTKIKVSDLQKEMAHKINPALKEVFINIFNFLIYILTLGLAHQIHEGLSNQERYGFFTTDEEFERKKEFIKELNELITPEEFNDIDVNEKQQPKQ